MNNKKGIWNIITEIFGARSKENSNQEIHTKGVITEKSSYLITSDLRKAAVEDNSVTIPDHTHTSLYSSGRSLDFIDKKYQGAKVTSSSKFNFTSSVKTTPISPEMQAIYDELTPTVDIEANKNNTSI